MSNPQRPADVEALLLALQAEIQAILGEQLVGLYLHGSLASGDFNPYRSDIDVIAVTEGEPGPQTIEALKALHASMASGDLEWAKKLEVSYIPRDAIRRFDPSNALHPALRADGTFDFDYHGPDWMIQRHVLREKGIALLGPDPKTLVDPVPPEDLRRGVLGVLHEWWQPMLTGPAFLAEPEYQAYAVHTMCRALYTLERLDVASKPVAARWALQALDVRFKEQFAALVEEALAWKRGDPFDHLGETLEMIRYTLERVREGGGGFAEEA